MENREIIHPAMIDSEIFFRDKFEAEPRHYNQIVKASSCDGGKAYSDDKNGSEIKHDLVIFDILSGNKQDDQIEFKTNRVIVLLLFTEFMQNVSFSIFAPFLPIIVTKHGISQRYFGIMF